MRTRASTDASHACHAEIPRDASESVSSPWKRLWKYVYSGPIEPHDGIHEWTVNWDKDEIEWFCDKKPVVSYAKTANAKLWPKQAMHIRYGLWAVTQCASTLALSIRELADYG